MSNYNPRFLSSSAALKGHGSTVSFSCIHYSSVLTTAALAVSMDMKQKAPVSVRALTGASNRTAEAARVLNSSIRQSAVNLKENHSDLPQLPHGLPEAR